MSEVYPETPLAIPPVHPRHDHADKASATHTHIDKSDINHTHSDKADTNHAHSDYLSKSAGGTVAGSAIFSAATTELRQIYLHRPGVDHVKLESGTQSGIYCLTIINPSTGALAPLRVGSPINGESAARVDWVQSDRAAANHGAHVNGVTTAVVTTNANGDVAFGYGGTGTPVCSNGDWGAMARAPHIRSWGGGSVTIGNLNANAICRLNVIGA